MTSPARQDPPLLLLLRFYWCSVALRQSVGAHVVYVADVVVIGAVGQRVLASERV